MFVYQGMSSTDSPSEQEKQLSIQTPLGGIDCTDVINSLVSRTASEQNSKLDTVSETLQQQQQQFSQMLTALHGLTQSLATVHNSPSATPPAPTERLNVSSDETRRQSSLNVSIETRHPGLNVLNGTQPPNAVGLRLRGRTNGSTASSEETSQHGHPPAGGDDHVSMAASNKWFQDLDPNPKGANDADSEGDGMLEGDQAYWQDSLGDYGDPDAYGSEVSSPIASAAKMFWEQPLKEDKFKRKMEAGKLPSNCAFLTTKMTNPEIFRNLPTFQRTVDSKIQDIQKLTGASASLLISAASFLTTGLATATLNNRDVDFKTPLDFLKDSLSLAGKANQMTNQLRRQLIKPTLPTKYRRLADIADESSTYLFGDKIAEVLDALNKEYQLRSLLNDKSPVTPKRKYQESSNSMSSSKTQKRTDYNQGQKQRSSHKKQAQQKPSYQQNHNQSGQHKSHHSKRRN